MREGTTSGPPPHLIEIKAAPRGKDADCDSCLFRETHMDPLASVGLIVVLIAAIAAGYYIMRPEKPQKN
jgi:hypothetical protein